MIVLTMPESGKGCSWDNLQRCPNPLLRAGVQNASLQEAIQYLCVDVSSVAHPRLGNASLNARTGSRLPAQGLDVLCMLKPTCCELVHVC